MSNNLAQTPLHAWHAAHQGRLVDFAGWSMPVQYSSIVAEHEATRRAVTLFDVSHMGRLNFEGPDAAAFLDRLVTRRLIDLAPGKIRYGLITNAEGGILDDVLVYHTSGPSDSARATYQMVVNASNREKIIAWLMRHYDGRPDLEIADRTFDTAMIAVQGPRAVATLATLVEGPLTSMKYYTGREAQIGEWTGYLSRTGYTGEDGFEIVVPARHAEAVWEAILAAGQPHGAQPAGLAARDTLRLEAGMPLYGHELSEQINPIQAGLAFAVNLEDREFIGREAIARFAQDPQQPRRVGLQLEGRRVPREGYKILSSSVEVGYVTSGTFSPTLDRPIAMGYVAPQYAVIGATLDVDLRGRTEAATVVPLPFYKRQS